MGLAFGLLFVGIGLFAFVRGVIHFRTAKASATWPSIEGQVTVAMVEMDISTDSDGTTSRRYSPRVVYQYSLGGQQYSGDQVIIGSKLTYPSQARAESKLAYQAGQRVDVFYNPQKPAQSVLEPGSTRGAWGTLLIGIVFFIAGVIIAMYNI